MTALFNIYRLFIPGRGGLNSFRATRNPALVYGL